MWLHASNDLPSACFPPSHKAMEDGFSESLVLNVPIILLIVSRSITLAL